jgi:fucose permease
VKFKIAVIHLGFALTGIVTTMLGPILPLLATQWHLNDAQAGRLFLVQFIASPTGALLASKVLSRWGASWTVPLGMFLIAAGVSTFSVGTEAAAFVGIALYALGLGFALPSTNLLVVELVSRGQAAALNILNFSWTVGALVGPFLIAVLLKPVGLRGFLLLVGACTLVIAVVEAGAFPKAHLVSASTRHGKLAPSRRLVFALMTFFLLFLYVGIENGFAGWLSTFSMRSQHTSEKATAIVQSSFWAALLLGRLAAPLMLRMVREGSLILGGLALASAGIVTAIASPSLTVLAAGVLLSGFGLAAIFPTTIAIFTEWFGTGGAGSIVLGCCGFGGALIPWLVGEVSTHSQNLRLGLAVPLACTAVAALVYWAMASAARERKASLAATIQ